MKFKKGFMGLLIIFVTGCSAGQIETITSSPQASTTGTDALAASPTRTSRPTKTPTPTLLPTETVPVATLNAFATVEALRVSQINQYPELQEYLSYCRPSYCSRVDVSPNQQNIYFSNDNVIDVFVVSGKRIGTYSFYDIYGSSHGYPIDFYEGYVTGVHWSRDGRYLYLATQQGDGGPGPHFGYWSALARVNLQNGTWKDTGISGVLAFSPNDKYIIYSTNLSEVRVRNLQNGEEKIYVTPEYYQYFGEFIWSPDNKK